MVLVRLVRFPYLFTFTGFRRRQRNAVGKLRSLAFASLSLGDISGTRGALIVASVYTVFIFRRQLFQLKPLIVAVVAVALTVTFLPPKIKHRYFDLLILQNDSDLEGSDLIAAESGKSRLRGLKKGFQTGLEHPIFGVGPGNSLVSLDVLIHQETATDNLIQLHNLYGQVAAEIGIVGLFIWSTTIGRRTVTIIGTRLKLQGSRSGSSCLRCVARRRSDHVVVRHGFAFIV